MGSVPLPRISTDAKEGNSAVSALGLCVAGVNRPTGGCTKRYFPPNSHLNPPGFWQVAHFLCACDQAAARLHTLWMELEPEIETLGSNNIYHSISCCVCCARALRLLYPFSELPLHPGGAIGNCYGGSVSGGPSTTLFLIRFTSHPPPY